MLSKHVDVNSEHQYPYEEQDVVVYFYNTSTEGELSMYEKRLLDSNLAEKWQASTSVRDTEEDEVEPEREAQLTSSTILHNHWECADKYKCTTMCTYVRVHTQTESTLTFSSYWDNLES